MNVVGVGYNNLREEPVTESFLNELQAPMFINLDTDYAPA